MSPHQPSAPQDLEYDRITMGSEPPPYSATRLSLDTLEEIGRRKKQKNVRRKTRCFKCIAGFFFCFILIMSITGILYNAVLNIKLEKTNTNIEELKEHFDTQQEQLLEVSRDLLEMSGKLGIVETDLENLKGVNEDIETINDIKEKMKSYADIFESAKILTMSKGNTKNREKRIEFATLIAFINC